jgi:acrylyl-CoA reductase (NADPH)
MFKALLLEETDGKVSSQITGLEDDRLPGFEEAERPVTVAVSHSTLNYKDGLILKGLARLVRSYPHIPGIDFAGRVTESRHPDFKPGDEVVLTGWRVGEAHWGGYAEKAVVKGDWLVRLPEGLSAKQAMAIGTAGFTAMLSVMALEEHGLTPDSGEVLVTGAAGGVGSIATAILAKLGYRVAGSSGRPELTTYLEDLGMTTLVPRSELAEPSKRPLEGSRWAGCIDSVGGTTLARVLAQLNHGASVASVGNAGGNTLETTVLPFLLRGVNLLGIDSALCPKARRERAWQRLAEELPLDKLDAMTGIATLEDLPGMAEAILKGKIRGRTVIEL